VGVRVEPSGSPFTIQGYSTSTTRYESPSFDMPFFSSDAFVHLRLSTSFGPPNAWFVDDVQVYRPGAQSTQVTFQ
jgi:hypothetical protein